MDASIYANWFNNGDGLMMIGGRNDQENTKEYRLFRLLLTDSGHYILPTDYEVSAKVSKETKREVMLFNQRIATASAQRWNDVQDRVRHCFMTYQDKSEHAEGDRCEPHDPETYNQDKDDIPEELYVIPEDEHSPKNQHDDGTTTEEDVSRKHANLADDQTSNHKHNDDGFLSHTDEEHFAQAILATKQLTDEDFPPYQEDQLPEGANYQKLKKRYQAMPEEFYTKSGLRPVTPSNFRRWFKHAKGRGLRWHAWELFSGTGRLSLILMMAGLIVGFPVDFRYGWDLNNQEHQQMIFDAQREFKPGVVHIAPDCAPWSVSSTSKDPQVRLQERQEAKPSLECTQQVCTNQSRHDRGYNMEQPLGSALFQEDLPENPLHLSTLQDCRKRQRIDQCMHNAEDEERNPIQKATGFSSNLKWSKTALRCSGHKGRQHSHLRGTAPDGLTRTSKAAAYPKAMCQRMKQDIINFLQKKGLLHLPKWPQHLQLFVNNHYYECTRCQLGRACPPDVPHTFVPKECRYGSPAAIAAKAKAAAKAKEPETLEDKIATSGNPINTWKTWTRREDLSRINIQDHLLPMLQDAWKHYLKKVLTEMTRNALEVFKESQNRRIAAGHWLDNQLHLTLIKEIFAPHMMVRGVRLEIGPYHKHDAQPQLAFDSSYLRLPVVGGVNEWSVGPIEDMRELSHNQINEAMDQDEWYITIFGTENQGIPSPSTPSRRSRSIPEGPAPSTPMASRAAAVRADALQDPAILELPEQPRGEEQALRDSVYESADALVPRPEEAEEFEARPHRDLAPLRPNYNLRRVLQRIPKLVNEGENAKAMQLLLGLHERLWHSPSSDFTNLLRRAGMSGEVINLAREAVQCCAICRKYVRMPNRPQLRARGANVFNQAVQMDLF